MPFGLKQTIRNTSLEFVEFFFKSFEVLIKYNEKFDLIFIQLNLCRKNCAHIVKEFVTHGLAASVIRYYF